AHRTVQVQAVVGRVLGDQNKLADAVAGEFAGLAEDFLDGLGNMAAAHAGDGAKGASTVAAFGNLEVSVVAGSDAQAGGVFLGPDRRGPKQRVLFGPVHDGPVDDLGDLFPAEDADDAVHP